MTSQSALQSKTQNSELVDLLADLVAIPSLSGGEHACQDFISIWFSKQGLAAEKQSAEDGLQNVVAEITGSRPGKTLFLGGHSDTISPSDGWDTPPYEPYVNDNRLYGLGAMDMKAGLAAAMLATRDMAKCSHDWSGRLIFAALADEEARSRGANAFVRDDRSIDAAIMCEPHFEKIGIGAIGKVGVTIEVNGKSAHGSYPKLGINAVVEAAKLMVAIDGLDRFTHSEFGTATHCVLGVGSGNRRHEIRVPDFCEFTINWHFMPGEKPQDAARHINELCETLDSEARFSVTLNEPIYESFLVEEDDQFVGLLRKCIGEVTGIPAQTKFCSGVSDANVFAGRSGIPTVLFGPGGSGMHSANEWADLDQLAKVHEIYFSFAMRFLTNNQLRQIRC